MPAQGLPQVLVLDKLDLMFLGVIRIALIADGLRLC